MYQFIEEAFPEFAKQKIDWDKNEIAYEFAAISLLLLGAKDAGWTIKVVKVPEDCRFDTWSTLPKHNFGTFGSKSRRTNINQLTAILQPRFILKNGSRVISIYYQGFPPLENSSDRPDWVIVEGSAKVICTKDGYLELKIENQIQSYHIRYDTLLSPMGPKILDQNGKVTVLGIVEASTNKSASFVENQLNRYIDSYSPRVVIAILGNEVTTSSPVIHFPAVKTQTVDEVRNKAQEVYGLLSNIL